MKIRASWIVVGAAVIVTAVVAIPRVKAWFPSRDAARIEQSTPADAAYAMFQAVDQGGGDTANPSALYRNQLDDTHLLSGKGMSDDERNFSYLFLDTQRSGVIYAYLRSKVATEANLTHETDTGDSAVLDLKVRILPERASDWIVSPCTVALKKQRANWYVEDVQFPGMPAGIYAAFAQRAQASRDSARNLPSPH